MRFWKPRTIPGTPNVGVACATWIDGLFAPRLQALKGLISAFKCQTWDHWMLEVTHDGPLVTNDLQKEMDALQECGRVEIVCTAERKQKFGHPWRQDAIDRLLSSGCEWIGLTNDDNYYVPVYLEWMLSEAYRHNSKFVYCDMIHSHKLWRPLPGEVKRGKIDLGSFLVHKDVATKIKFDQTHFAADWDYISRVRAAAKKVAKVQATLFVHN
jgi:hypothetical protein